MNTSKKNNIPAAFAGMTNLFPVTKTLAFRLVPLGKTEENLKKEEIGVVAMGNKLDDQYGILKEASNRLHKAFIEDTMKDFRLKALSEGKMDSVQEYAETLASRDIEQDEKKKLLETITMNLKKQIGKAFADVRYKNGPMIKALGGKLLVTELLSGGLISLSEKEMEAVEDTKSYTSLMKDYSDRRVRLYSAEQKGHTVPVRIVDDNLPIHFANSTLFRRLPETLLDKFAENQELNEYIKKNTEALTVSDIFTISYGALLNSQSAITAYNTVIGGYSEDTKKKVQGLNEIINEWNQKNKDARVDKFTKLKKQILTDRKGPSFIPKVFKNDAEVVDAVKAIKEDISETLQMVTPEVLHPAEDKVLIKANQLKYFSHAFFKNWKAAEYCVKAVLKERNPRGPRVRESRWEKEIDKLFKAMKLIPVADILEGARLEGKEMENSFSEYLAENIIGKIRKGMGCYDLFMTELSNNGNKPLRLGQDNATGKLGIGRYVKEYLDATIEAFRCVKLFGQDDKELSYDMDFYGMVVDPLNDLAEDFIGSYNSIRNHLTKKPYSTDKVRLYFGNPSLMNGWDMNKYESNRSFLMREGNKFFLGVISNKAKKFINDPALFDESSSLKLFQMRKPKAAYMSLSKFAFGNGEPRKGAPYFPSEEVWELVRDTRAKKIDVKDYTVEQVHALVDFYKKAISINKDYDMLKFEFKPTREYNKLDEFFKDVDAQAYTCFYQGVSREYIEEAINEGNFYMFEITCQDMAEKHTGKDGDYKILLFEALSGNVDSKVRIGGGAAVYYRPASMNKRITHPKGKPIANKNPDNPYKTKVPRFDMYMNRRFMEDRYMLHLPVTINPDADAKGTQKVNTKVQEIIRRNPGMYVLGVNRGERNLLSIAVTAPDGTIIEQKNLNVFDNFDYRYKLATREKERIDDRTNWNSVRDIKNIKKGYLSRAVGEIVRLVKKYGCVIAMENLDLEFKNGRQAFEKNVYQQFERDLVGKLGLLMDKDDPERVNSALQLSNIGETVQDRTAYSQSGIVFFVNPSWVTRTDPVTGFVSRLKIYYKNIKESEAFMSNLDGFRYNPATGRFVLTFHYGKAAPEAESNNPDKVWNVETYGTRIENKLDISDKNPKGKWYDIEHDLTAEMKKLLDDNGVAWSDGEDLRPRLNGKGESFWKGLFELFRLTVQNTSWDSEKKEYRVVGCTCDYKGRFFDTRNASESLPMDGDTNAARNIARKAHLILESIRNCDPEGKDKPKLTVSDEKWFASVEK